MGQTKASFYMSEKIPSLNDWFSKEHNGKDSSCASSRSSRLSMSSSLTPLLKDSELMTDSTSVGVILRAERMYSV